MNLGVATEQIYFQFRKRQFDAITQNKRLGVFHVTDYVKECMRNTYYAHLKSNVKKSMDTTSLSHFFGGEAIHKLLDTVSGENGELGMAYDFINDRKVNLFTDDGEVNPAVKSFSVEDWLNILIGERDALYTIKDDKNEYNVIVDYKTWLSKGFKKKEASPEHVFQLNEYRYLFNKALGKDAKYGAVIYLDFADKMAKPLIFPVKLAEIDETHKKLLEKHSQLLQAYKTGVLPPRVKTWLCDGYCPYAQRCFNEETLTKEENQLEVTV